MTDPATAALVAGRADWLALALALTFTAACILVGWRSSGDDLEAAQRDLDVDELWLDGDDWIEA